MKKELELFIEVAKGNWEDNFQLKTIALVLYHVKGDRILIGFFNLVLCFLTF